MNPDLIYTLALTYIPGLGPINQKKILKVVDARSLWNYSESELKEVFRKRKDLIANFKKTEYLELAHKEIEWCRENDVEILHYDSERYPGKLRNCLDSPLVLFKKGQHDFNRNLHIAIVGTRKMTSYGEKFIENFIAEITSQNIVIVSGLAYGCDIEAHRFSIQNDIPNIAVLAHGLNKISPSAHKKEAAELQKNGALLTEYSTFHNAEPINFVLRNRIIAGLCDAVIVVESDKKGGALATAGYANSYNREVFAVPGRTEDKYSLGCNELIQSHQAYMIRNTQDLLNYFNLQSKPKPIQSQLFIELEEEEKIIYDYLRKNGKQQIDTLYNSLGIPVFKLNGILLNMEIKGIIKPLPGKFFEIS